MKTARRKIKTTDRLFLVADPCSYCGCPSSEIDHIEPCWSGGTSEPSNLTASCSVCNASKGGLPLLLWLALRRSGGDAFGPNDLGSEYFKARPQFLAWREDSENSFYEHRFDSFVDIYYPPPLTR